MCNEVDEPTQEQQSDFNKLPEPSPPIKPESNALVAPIRQTGPNPANTGRPSDESISDDKSSDMGSSPLLATPPQVSVVAQPEPAPEAPRADPPKPQPKAISVSDSETDSSSSYTYSSDTASTSSS